MLNKIKLISGITLFLFLTGCMSVNVQQNLDDQKLSLSESEVPVAHISYYNYGYYLFGFIPVVTGDPIDEEAMTFFDDTMTIRRAMKSVIRESKSLGADKMLNLTTRRKVFPTVASFFTFSYVEIQISCDVVKSSDQKPVKNLDDLIKPL